MLYSRDMPIIETPKTMGQSKDSRQTETLRKQEQQTDIRQIKRQTTVGEDVIPNPYAKMKRRKMKRETDTSDYIYSKWQMNMTEK